MSKIFHRWKNVTLPAKTLKYFPTKIEVSTDYKVRRFRHTDYINIMLNAVRRHGLWFVLALLFVFLDAESKQENNRAYLMPMICGFSPGILTSDSFSRLRTCEMACTVAATNHGRPSSEQTKMRIARTNRSRWYPCGFYDHTPPATWDIRKLNG